MKLAFNEVSFRPYVNSSQELYTNLESVLKIYEYLKKRYGYKHILCPVNITQINVLQEINFLKWFEDLGPSQKNKILLLLLKRPYIDEELGDNTEELNRYYFESENPFIEQQYCHGLATAYISTLPSVSLPTHDIWKVDEIEFNRYNDQMTDSEVVKAPNFSTGNIESYDAFIKYCEENYEIELEETPLSDEDKPIKLSGDHHGNKELEKLAKKMCRNEYVTGILNNLEFKSKSSRFIRKVKPNGIVEITMHWEDEGFGMAVQTTGKNLQETEKIAKILRDKFDK